MKLYVRIFAAILVVSAILVAVLFLTNNANPLDEEKTLVIYNWGDYIDPELIEKFEQETGIQVIYETFDSNEAMLVKIQQGGTRYDLVVPSDYMISIMIKEGLLLPIDKTKLTNYSHLGAYYLEKTNEFDPGNKYSVPYFWGTLGIGYNPDLLDGMTIDSWSDLWDPSLKNKILLVDSVREVMGLGLDVLGYSLNETNADRLREAQAKLIDLKPNIQAIAGDEIKMLLGSNQAPIAVTWSGEIMEAMSENESIEYVVPTEGSNIFFDNLAIPTTAKNIEGAHLFINFMLNPENSKQNTEYVGYSTPNDSAYALLDDEIKNDTRFYPTDEIKANLEVYNGNLDEETLTLYNDLFLEFKLE